MEKCLFFVMKTEQTREIEENEEEGEDVELKQWAWLGHC